MRYKEQWERFQHPTGWTRDWFKIPFEGLMSLQPDELKDTIGTIDDWI